MKQINYELIKIVFCKANLCSPYIFHCSWNEFEKNKNIFGMNKNWIIHKNDK